MRNRMLLFALLLLALAAPAGASAIQGWNLSGVNVVNMTSFDAYIFNSAQTFDAPGATSFNVVGWSAGLIGSQHVQASGAATSNLNFNFLFTTPASPFDIDIYNQSGVFVESWHFADQGIALGSLAGWTQNRQPSGDPMGAVPEPASMAMLGGGLIVLGWVGRRRLNKA